MTMDEKNVTAKTVSEALGDITKFIQTNYIAEKMGKPANLVSAAKTHKKVNGREYFLPETELENLNNAIHAIGFELYYAKLDPEKSERVVDQLEKYRNILVLNKIATVKMQKVTNWLSKRTAKPVPGKEGSPVYFYYDKFTEEDIASFNRIFAELSAELMNLKIVLDNKPQTQE